MHGEARDFFSIVPKYIKNTNDLNDENTKDLINGNQTENSTSRRSKFLEKARHGLDNIRSQPWSGAAAEILQVTGEISYTWALCNVN